MASEQSRRENVTSEREVHVEKDRVPKMTTHFEALVEKAKDSDVTGGKETPHDVKDESHASHGKARETHHQLGTHGFESLSEKPKNVAGDKDRETVSYADKARKGGEEQHREEKTTTKTAAAQPSTVGKFEVTGEEKKGREGRQTQPSLAEIGQLRAKAQQNSVEALRAAEERYNQANKEASSQRQSRTGTEATATRQRVSQTGTERPSQLGSQAKETILDTAQKTSQYAAEKGSHAKDTIYTAGKTAMDYTAPKAEQAKDYTMEKAAVAKDTAVDASKKVAGYTAEKAVEAKDMAVEGGKGAAGVVSKVAAAAKDQAVVAGWATAHLTTKAAVEGTKVAAKAAEYTAEKTLEGTKAVASAVADMASKPLGAAKEAAASTGESMKEYTARKKEEAQRGMETKKSAPSQTEVYTEVTEEKPGEMARGERRSKLSETKEKAEDLARPVKGTFQEVSDEASKQQERGGQGAGGVLQAIGETVVEIAQTTKEFVVGEGQIGEKMVGDYGTTRSEHAKNQEE